MEDLHESIYKAQSAIKAIKNLVGESDQTSLVVTGWEMICLLEPIEQRLTTALEMLVGSAHKRS